MWAAATAPPSHGSPPRSGDWATADTTSHNPPLLLAAPERPGAPSCLRRRSGGSQGSNRGMGQRPFGYVSLLPVWIQETKRENEELEGKIVTVFLLSLKNSTGGIHHSRIFCGLIQNSHHHPVGMTTLPDW